MQNWGVIDDRIRWGHARVLRGRAQEGKEERGAKEVCASLREVASITVVPISANAGVSIVDEL